MWVIALAVFACLLGPHENERDRMGRQNEFKFFLDFEALSLFHISSDASM